MAKVETVLSSWTGILKGVPQRSVIRPILFNMLLKDLFFIFKETEICSYADDTIPVCI